MTATYNFALSNTSIVQEAFDRIGVRPVEITREQMSSAYRSLNLELQSWSNRPINLWEISLVQITLVEGQSEYVLDQNTEMIADAYVSLVQNGQPAIDRILVPISRDEWSEYPLKTQEGPPSVFWFKRTITPSIVLWPVPDGTTETYCNLYVMKRIADANLSATEYPDIPYRFIDALAARLAARLAVKYAKDQLAILQPLAEAAYQAAWEEDKERAQLYITPIFQIYDPLG